MSILYYLSNGYIYINVYVCSSINYLEDTNCLSEKIKQRNVYVNQDDLSPISTQQNFPLKDNFILS